MSSEAPSTTVRDQGGILKLTNPTERVRNLLRLTRLNTVLDVIEGWLAEQFAERGIQGSRKLARQVMLLIEGCHSLVLIHGDTCYADAASAAAQTLVESCQLEAPRGQQDSQNSVPSRRRTRTKTYRSDNR